jgi:hypothetical protein
MGVIEVRSVPPFDAVGLDAFDQLLSRPDPPDLPRRAHV